METLDTFTQAYIRAAFWSSTVDDGEPLEDVKDDDELAPETLTHMINDCATFQAANSKFLADLDDGQAGHDFWLTRNGHGAGFWDRDHEKVIGDALTDASDLFGGFDLYVGDDGKVYGG